MRIYNLESNAPDHVNDQFIVKKQMRPFWIIADLYGDHVNREGKYWCFIGGHYPEGLMSDKKDEYNSAVELIITGKWQKAWLADEETVKSNRKVGYGFGDNPNQAFKRAIVCAGYLKDIHPKQEHVLQHNEGCE